MRNIAISAAILLLAGCASGAAARLAANKEAVILAKECPALPSHGMRARCIGTKMLEADSRHGVDPKYDLQKIKGMTDIEDAVDKGLISEQDADQRIALLFSEIDAIADSDDRGREQASNAAAGAALQQGFQNASRSFQNGAATLQPSAYHSPTTCMTQPSGGGFVTSCNH